MQNFDNSSVSSESLELNLKSNRKKLAKVSLAVLLIAALSLGGYQYNNKIQMEKKIRMEQQARAKAAAEEARKLREAEAAERAEYLRALEDDSWLPAGYTKFSLNPYLAYKRDSNFSRCGSYGTCFPFTLITNTYCSSVYIEGNVIVNGSISDWSNDTAQGIGPGDKVQMKLQFSEERKGTVRWTEANCR